MLGDLASKLFSISKDGDSTAFLGSLLRCPVISMVHFPPLCLKRISSFLKCDHHFSCHQCMRSSVLFLWQEHGSVISAFLYLAAAESNKVSPSPSPLKAEQTQFFWLLLICHVLILPAILWTCSSLSKSFLQRGASSWKVQMQPHKCQIKWNNCF